MTTILSCRERTVHFFKNNSDLLGSCSILALNIALFVSKIFKNIFVANLAYTILNFTGLFYFPHGVRDLLKDGKDLFYAITLKDHRAILLTVVKVIIVAIDAALLLVNCGAALLMLLGFPEISALIYLVTRPIAILSLVTSMALGVANIFLNEDLLKRIKEKTPEERRSLALDVRSLSIGKSASPKPFAASILRQLDPYALEKMRQEEKGEALYKMMKSALRVNQTIAHMQSMREMLGYVALFLIKLFPNTLFESSCLLGSSLFYTGELVYEKIARHKATHGKEGDLIAL